MPNIQLPDDQFQKLSVLANAAGYKDVSAFIASFVEEPAEDPRGDLTDADLQASIASIRQGMAELEAGDGHDLDEVMRSIAEKHGFKIPK